MGMEAEVPEGLAATRLLNPLLPLPLPQWQDLQNYGGGSYVQQADRGEENRGEQKEMEEKMLILNVTNMEVKTDGKSSPLACSSCSEIFVNCAMLKKHREKHVQEQINQL